MSQKPYEPSKHEQQAAEERREEREAQTLEHAREPDKRSSSEAVAHEEKQKPLPAGEAVGVTDAARLAWAKQAPQTYADSLGRSWTFEIVSDPIHGLKLTCDGISLGLTAAQIEAKDPDAVHTAVADLDEAMPPGVQPQGPGAQAAPKG
jgi:hypothetical protein